MANKMLFSCLNKYTNDKEIVYSDYYKIPTPKGTAITQSLSEFAESMGKGYEGNDTFFVEKSFSVVDATGVNDINIYSKKITSSGIFPQEIEQIGESEPTIKDAPPPYDIESKELQLENGIYKIKYAYIGAQGVPYEYEGQLSVTENRLPLKKWTILDVINRTFDLIEPLRYGEKPRFRLDGVIYDDITGRAIGYLTKGGGINLDDTSESAINTVLKILEKENEKE